MSDERPREGFLGGVAEGFARCLERGGAAGRGVLLAVSGGADSTALLLAGAEVARGLGLTLEVASIDHGLRAGSAEEAAGVEALARGLGLFCTVRPVALRGGAGLEARARAARYAALEAIREARGLTWIATAHTADDQAETLWMRLARGAALRGAAGIREVRGRVVRPLLRLRRAEARAFLQARGVAWREDPMNADPSFLRVRVRQRLSPLLTEVFGADPTPRLAAFAEQAADDDAFLFGLADAALTRMMGPEGLDRVALRALAAPVRRRVFVRLMEARGISPSQDRLRQAERALEEGGRVALLRGQILDARGGWVRWERPLARAPDARPLGLGQTVRFGAFEVGATEVGASERVPADAPWSAPLPAGAFPLTVRARRPGDRIEGRGGARRLQDVLVDARVPREQRDGLPVVCDREGTARWVGGVSLPKVHPGPGAVWIWARRAREASEEAGPSL